MKIEHVTINITPPSAITAALLAALTPARADASTAAEPAPQVLRIGEPWPGVDGVYAGVARGRDGEIDGHLVLLNVKPEGDLNWSKANAWAEGLGDGSRLPTRFESALLYANLQDEFDKDRWHWTGTQFSAGFAWTQDFGDGTQLNDGKSFEARARAVRRFPL